VPNEDSNTTGSDGCIVLVRTFEVKGDRTMKYTASAGSKRDTVLRIIARVIMIPRDSPLSLG
jgi:hypothetical protein